MKKQINKKNKLRSGMSEAKSEEKGEEKSETTSHDRHARLFPVCKEKHHAARRFSIFLFDLFL